MRNYFKQRFPAFSSRDFSIFWPTQLISNTGTQMQFVALNWQIYILTHSALALGLISFLRFAPILFFSLIGGSFADAHNRKVIIFITQSSLAILSLILALATLNHTINTNIIYLITILSTIILSFDIPARQALIPKMVDKKHLTNALTLAPIQYQLAEIFGPALSGILIANAGLSHIYFLNAISFLFVIVSIFFFRAPGKAEGKVTPISITTIIEGFTFVKSKTMIWSTMLLDFFSSFFASATALLPIFARDILTVGPEKLGLLYAAPSIGAVFGALMLTHKHNLRHQGIILLTSIVVCALSTIVFGISKIFIISFFALVLIGGGNGISFIIRNTIRQLEAPDHLRGRLSAINLIFNMGGPQLGGFEAGVVANYASGPISVVTGGIGAIFVVILMTIGIPTLRRYDQHPLQINNHSLEDNKN